MDYQDASIASDLIKCNNIIGVHYDTFGYIKINEEEAIAYFKGNGKTLTLPAIGSSIEL
jgi:L-ascorbate metabolism protein UlaG (beta-lactamase superfamily)